jgi:hypothetical protein
MKRLVQEIVEHQLDRAALRARRRDLEEAPDDTPTDAPPVRKPFRFQFRDAERAFSVSLAFRTESEPEPREVIEALRGLIRDLEANLDSQS